MLVNTPVIADGNQLPAHQLPVCIVAVSVERVIARTLSMLSNLCIFFLKAMEVKISSMHRGSVQLS